jgi:hypothetical protein
MRKGFEGLSALVRDKLSQDPTSGHLFFFSQTRHATVSRSSFGMEAACGSAANGLNTAAFDGEAAGSLEADVGNCTRAALMWVKRAHPLIVWGGRVRDPETLHPDPSSLHAAHPARRPRTPHGARNPLG